MGLPYMCARHQSKQARHRLCRLTWPISMLAVFFRLLQGVYTIVTLFVLQPERADNRGCMTTAVQSLRSIRSCVAPYGTRPLLGSTQRASKQEVHWFTCEQAVRLLLPVP